MVEPRPPRGELQPGEQERETSEQTRSAGGCTHPSGLVTRGRHCACLEVETCRQVDTHEMAERRLHGRAVGVGGRVRAVHRGRQGAAVELVDSEMGLTRSQCVLHRLSANARRASIELCELGDTDILSDLLHLVVASLARSVDSGVAARSGCLHTAL